MSLVFLVIVLVAVCNVQFAIGQNCCADLPGIIQNLQNQLNNKLDKPTCKIQLHSWGFDDNVPAAQKSSQIVVNGVNYVKDGGVVYRGINVLPINQLTCTPGALASFDTYGNAAAGVALNNYLNALPDSTFLVGVASDAAEGIGTNNLGNARVTLKSMGVNIDSLQFREKLVFELKKGNPSKSVSKLAPRYGSPIELEVTP